MADLPATPPAAGKLLPPWERPVRIPEGVPVELARPEAAVAGEKSVWRLRFRLKNDVPPGGVLKLQLFGGRNNRIAFENAQVDSPGEDGYLSVQAEDGKTLPVRADERKGTFTFEAPGTGLRKGSLLTAVLGDRSSGGGGITAPTIRALSKFFVVYRPEAESTGRPAWTEENWEHIVGACLMHVLGGEIHHLRAYGPSVSSPGEPLEILVRPEDEHSNLSCRPLEDIAVYLADEELPGHVERVPESTCVRVRVRLPHEGVHRLRVVDRRTGNEAFTNPTVCGAALPEHNVYWGTIHGHTEMSDGTGSIEYYFRQMRDEAALDFGAPGDHDQLWETSDAMWKTTCEAVSRWNEPGRFVTFLGYEWAKWRRNGDGDRNVYYFEDGRPMYRSDVRCYPRPPDLFRALAGEQALVIPHHTAHSGNFCDWKDHNPSAERLVEIYQIRGSYECSAEDGNPLPERYDTPPVAAGYVRRALAAGWRVGFTAGGDDHLGHSGTEFPIAAGRVSYKSGLMSVLAEELTREAIWDAMCNRRVVATTGARILLSYELNGSCMGSELDLALDPGLARARRLRVEFHGTAPVDRIEIIRNNEVVHIFPGGDLDCDLSWEDTARLLDVLLKPVKFCANPFCFYYVRAVQTDGEVAWASPVWIDAK